MEKGQVEFSIKSLELGGNSEKNYNVQIFFFINSNCTYLRPLEKMLQPNGDCQTDGLTDLRTDGLKGLTGLT